MYRIGAVGSALCWAITAVIIYPELLWHPVRSLWVSLLVFVPSVLILGNMSSETWSSALTNRLSLGIICLLAVIFETHGRYDRRVFKVALVSALIVFCVFGVFTALALMVDPEAARAANREAAQRAFRKSPLVGRYDFVYVATQLAPLLLFALLRAPKISLLFRTLMLVSVVISAAVVLLGGYTLAIIALLGGFIIVLALQRINAMRVVLISMGLLVLLGLGNLVRTKGLEWLKSETEGNFVYEAKFEDYYASIATGHAMGHHVTGRLKRYESSLDTFLKYPVVGQYIFDRNISGGHSVLIDIPGNYGWLIAALFYNLVFWTPLRIAGVKGYSAPKLALIFSSLLIGLLDPYSQAQALVWFMVFPYVCWLTEGQVASPERVVRRAHRPKRRWRPLSEPGEISRTAADPTAAIDRPTDLPTARTE